MMAGGRACDGWWVAGCTTGHFPINPRPTQAARPERVALRGLPGVPRQGFKRGEGQAGLSSADEGKVPKQDLACCRWAAVSVLLVCGAASVS